ncbi:hypothetical protein RALTA_B1878 [Cupriavidus taiwanensis LMG 19424]|uniref:Uncharacterized protein n=1 Tax=Cupriavidus taiwanensis (strain DSM 17343 / BCRC 17206 / CCUG 44338 / CIP 107171 / LMG 19424 / R1) TaxID=977880 RepID=B3RC36_CUPTR|nr:hypothetical protein RALTA_B1878 [Cupriavidus taiwanensis LMG 19424]
MDRSILHRMSLCHCWKSAQAICRRHCKPSNRNGAARPASCVRHCQWTCRGFRRITWTKLHDQPVPCGLIEDVLARCAQKGHRLVQSRHLNVPVYTWTNVREWPN